MLDRRFYLWWVFLPMAAASLLLAQGSSCDAEKADPIEAGNSKKAEIVEQLLEPVDLINQQIRLGWQAHGVRPSRQATRGEWCRRVFLDLLGRVPTTRELDAFLSSPANTTSRVGLVDRLLGSEYQDQYARNWRSIWTNILIGRTGGSNRRDRTNRAGMMEYLQESLRTNKPYDRIVHELLTATGSTSPTEEDFNGATNFLVDKLAEKGVQATTKTAQVFLGLAVGCTQCHNHPFNEARQNQFWELNAFFRQARVEVTRDPDNNGRIVNAMLTDVDFAGEGPFRESDRRDEIVLELRAGRLVDRDAASLGAAPVFYELRNGQVRVAYPVFVDGTSLAERFSKEYPDRGAEFGNSSAVKDVHRRRELADLVIVSNYLELALVNRMWAHFFGRGFTRPIHDMGPHHPPSHPELLAGLGVAIRKANFDLKQLQRWMVLSDPYALSSRFSRNNTKDDPALGGPPLFSRFYLRQMQAEQLYESLLVATQAQQTVSKEERGQLKQRWLRQFSTAFGTDDQSESNTFNGSIPQMLMMLNGDLVERACSIGNGSFLDQIATDTRQTNREKINHLYRAALARQPTRQEIQVCNRLLQSRGGDVAQSLQDIWWAVLNSNEFILIH
jgi:hypothetical protein